MPSLSFINVDKLAQALTSKLTETQCSSSGSGHKVDALGKAILQGPNVDSGSRFEHDRKRLFAEITIMISVERLLKPQLN
jgi:hypothetical protein